MRAHACHRCGQDLTRVRAVPDPVYQLPLVQCPRCRYAVVRARNRARQFWWSVGRIEASIGALLLQMVAAVTTGAVLFGIAWGLARAWPIRWAAMTLEAWIYAAVIVVFVLVVGVWTTACFPHWRRPLATVTYSALVITVCTAFALLAHAFELRHVALHGGHVDQVDWPEFGRTVAALALLGVVSLGGVGPGLLMERSWAEHRRTLWRRRRKRWKNKRQSR